MLESIFVPVVISIMPIPAEQSCWSLVSSYFPIPKTAFLGWAAEGMGVAWMRVLAMEVKRGNGVKIGFRAEL